MILKYVNKHRVMHYLMILMVPLATKKSYKIKKIRELKADMNSLLFALEHSHLAMHIRTVVYYILIK